MATRYQRGIQRPYAQGYTTQWPNNTKGVFRSRKPKDIQHNDHKILKGYSGAVSRMIYNTMATRYQRGIQKPSTEGYTTQWPQDTKGVFRNRKSKDIQHNGHKIQKG